MLYQTHIVSFDNEGKIAQIRQSWDQGSLLKQLDVIGKTGRNWPIRDSQEQIKLIIRSSGKPVEETPSDIINRSRGNSTNAMRDPHTTLNLFAPRDQVEPPSSVVSPYAGSRPHQRSFTDILGDEPEEVGSPSGGRERSQSPSKAIAPKIGASKKFQPPRLFEESEDRAPSESNTPDAKSPDRFLRPHPKKYQHFDFADGSEPADAPKAGVAFHEMPKGKHGSHWDFQDFVTPQKPQSGRVRQQEIRHWNTDETEDQEPTAKKPAAAKPRRDAETHFELQDDGLPSGQPRPAGRPRGATHNEGLGLYKNHMVSDDGTEPPATPDSRTLTNITNLKDRSKIFDPHFDMNDESPHASPPKHQSQISDDRAKAVKMMESNWSAYDESPASQKENSNPTRLAASKDRKENGPNHRITIAGDGMGNKKGGRGWSIGDEGEADNNGITIAGDGMGNKKGGRGWSIGDESDEEQNAPAARVPGKKQGAQATGGNFWDF